jgi:hypothetical protein
MTDAVLPDLGGIEPARNAANAAKRPTWLFAAVLAVVLTGALFAAERRLDFFLGEEGFLWYGAMQTAHGGVPLRDFFSYDPGRYLWAAGWAQVFGDGILALRLSTALFQALGLFCGLLAARRAVARRWQLALAGAVLLLWMVPRNKLFEPSLLMMAVLAGVLLLEKPSLRRHAGAGALVGLAAFFGKNHGLYLGLAFLCLILVLFSDGEERSLRDLGRRLLAWGGGIVLGLAPLWIMLLVIPGFFTAYVDSIRFFLVQGKTNFPLPVPWPWRAIAQGTDLADHAFVLSLGLGFLLMPLLFGGAVLAALVRRGGRRRVALLTSCGFIGLFYMHHAFSRADYHHLLPTSPPLLLGLLGLTAALPAGRPRRVAAAALAPLLAFLTFFLGIRDRPLYEALVLRGTPDAFVPFVDAGGDRLWLSPDMARLFTDIRRVVEERVPPGEPLLIAPDRPGLYALLRRKAPVWDIYTLWPDRGGLDARMLREMREKNVRWALVRDPTLDDRRDLRFSRIRPHLWDYLMEDFERIPPEEVPLPHRLALLHKVQGDGDQMARQDKLVRRHWRRGLP